MKNLVFALGACIFAAVGLASAQENMELSAQAIVVNPDPSYEVRVFVDKDPSGQGVPSYAVGDKMRIGVSVTEDAYVYLFNLHSDGGLTQIFPNNYDDNGMDNYLVAGTTRYFPEENAGYSFTIEPPAGMEKVVAVASLEPLNTSELASFAADPNFASSTLSEQQFEDGLRVIVEPLGTSEWVSDTALFYSGGLYRGTPAWGTTAPSGVQQVPPSVSSYGTLDISSEPSGARVYVDEVYVGNTPLRYGTRAGAHQVRLELSGYRTVSGTVEVAGGSTKAVPVRLSSSFGAPSESTQDTAQSSEIGITSSPPGAQVYLGDRYLGTTPMTNVAVPVGVNRARFVLDGYADTYSTFEVTAGIYRNVSVHMSPAAAVPAAPAAPAVQGVLELSGNVAGAMVYVDGQQVGTIPSAGGTLALDALSAGKHEVAVTAPGYNTYLSEFEIIAGQTTSLQVSQMRR